MTVQPGELLVTRGDYKISSYNIEKGTVKLIIYVEENTGEEAEERQLLVMYETTVPIALFGLGYPPHYDTYLHPTFSAVDNAQLVWVNKEKNIVYHKKKNANYRLSLDEDWQFTGEYVLIPVDQHEDIIKGTCTKNSRAYTEKALTELSRKMQPALRVIFNYAIVENKTIDVEEEKIRIHEGANFQFLLKSVLMGKCNVTLCCTAEDNPLVEVNLPIVSVWKYATRYQTKLDS